LSFNRHLKLWIKNWESSFNYDDCLEYEDWIVPTVNVITVISLLGVLDSFSRDEKLSRSDVKVITPDDHAGTNCICHPRAHLQTPKAHKLPVNIVQTLPAILRYYNRSDYRNTPTSEQHCNFQQQRQETSR
jgi:hypothetical protein